MRAVGERVSVKFCDGTDACGQVVVVVRGRCVIETPPILRTGDHVRLTVSLGDWRIGDIGVVIGHSAARDFFTVKMANGYHVLWRAENLELVPPPTPSRCAAYSDYDQLSKLTAERDEARRQCDNANRVREGLTHRIRALENQSYSVDPYTANDLAQARAAARDAVADRDAAIKDRDMVREALTTWQRKARSLREQLDTAQVKHAALGKALKDATP